MDTITTKTIKGLALEMQAALITAKRDDGKSFVSLADGSPDWMRDVCYAAHQPANEMPNDATYEVIKDVLEAITDIDAPEDDIDRDSALDAVQDIEGDTYTSSLIGWLNVGRVAYLDQAIADMGAKTGFDALVYAQKIWIDEIGAAVVDALDNLT